MTDLEFGIGNAGMKVWPSSSWSLCYFHVHMNNSEKMDALQIPKKIQGVIQNQIATIHAKNTMEEALQQWEQFKDGLLFLHDPNLTENPIRLSISKW